MVIILVERVFLRVKLIKAVLRGRGGKGQDLGKVNYVSYKRSERESTGLGPLVDSGSEV